jgi:hypothetical protein
MGVHLLDPTAKVLVDVERRVSKRDRRRPADRVGVICAMAWVVVVTGTLVALIWGWLP